MNYLSQIAQLIGIPFLILIVMHLGYRLIRNGAIVRKYRMIINFSILLVASLVFFYQLTFQYQPLILRIHYFLLGFCLAFIVIKILETFLIERVFNKQATFHFPLFVRDILRLIILIAIAVIMLNVFFGIKPSTFVVTSTVLSAVIGLAMQDMLGNIISGIALQVEKPFRVGDWVKISDREGSIVEMSWRSTKLKTRENDFIIIPNTAVGKQEIFNYYLPDPLHAIRVYIKVNYQTPPNTVKSAILKVINTHHEVLKEPAATVFTYKFCDLAIEYEVKCWITDYFNVTRIQDELQTMIWYQLKREKIEIGVLYQELMFWKGNPEMIPQQKTSDVKYAEILENFQHIRILSPFNQQQLEELAHQVKCEWYGKDEILVKQGNPGSSFYIIKSGQVEVLIDGENGETNSVGSFGVHYFFGEMALLTGEPRSATIRAQIDTEAIIISKEDFGRLLNTAPQLAETLSELLEQRLAELKTIKDDADLKRASRKKQDQHDSRTLLRKIHSFFNLSGF